MRKLHFYLIELILITLLFFAFPISNAFAQCGGQTRCGVEDAFGNCDPNREYNTGCDGGCNPEGCGNCTITSSCSGGTGGTGGWTCFPAGTKVTMEGESEKNIEDIKAGDKILSQSEDGAFSISTVSELEEPLRDHMCQLDFTDGEILKLTNEHPLMTSDGWKSIAPNKTLEENPNLVVESLAVGDKIVKQDGNLASIKNIFCWSKPTQAYNLILEDGAHTYFADGYLAHNKGGYDYPVCGAGTTLSCLTPSTGNFCVDYRGKSCGDIFPSRVYSTMSYGCAGTDPDTGEPVPGGACQTNCNCCPVGQTNNCTAGTVWDYEFITNLILGAGYYW